MTSGGKRWREGKELEYMEEEEEELKSVNITPAGGSKGNEDNNKDWQ